MNKTVKYVLSGFAASLVGIGLSRFAYTPAMPYLISQGWLDENHVFLVGSASFLGYFIGAFSSPYILRLTSPRYALRLAFFMSGLAFLCCCYPYGTLWFMMWRFIVGLSGGVLTAVAAPTLLSAIDPKDRARSGGIMFSGAGLGLLLSALFTPVIASIKVYYYWGALFLITLVFFTITYRFMPNTNFEHIKKTYKSKRIDYFLYFTYGINVAALMPYILFLVNFVLLRTIPLTYFASIIWLVYAFGAFLGTIILGIAAKRTSYRSAILFTNFVQLFASLLLLLFPDLKIALSLSAFIMGAATPGIVPLYLGLIGELSSSDSQIQQIIWSRAVSAFALSQAIAAYMFTWLFYVTENYTLIFSISAFLLFILCVWFIQEGHYGYKQKKNY
ncbi:YbfB/YjiJ family MFS transporter [Bartonella rattaustraliani]|uniref:YbfB/YjiJ family MFS transporter n=1 Tax=Bartonella rattaustraliani TaxID=481139 RepID=UPI00030011A9|nr:YbfB/YjiJ family MFS transporter [Bartonella rattaustraliani]